MGILELSSGLLKMLELSDPTLAPELIAAVRERVMELFAPLRPMLAQVFVQALENIDTNELSIGPVRR